MKIVLTLSLLAYPILVYLGLQYFHPNELAIVIGLIFIFRFFIVGGIQATSRDIAITLIGLCLSLSYLLWDNFLLIKLYPVLINVMLLLIFAYSLYSPPSILTQLAQKFQKTALPLIAINYTKNLTLIWCIFFIINGSIALWTTLYAPITTWTLYNGCISYILIGLLFGIEFCVRQYVIRRQLS